MSLFVLREGFKVVNAPSGGGRIIHVRTGDELEVSREHAKLLERAAEVGLDSMDPWLIEVVERYRSLGLLVPATFATAPAQVPAAQTAAAPAPARAVAGKLEEPAMRPVAPEHPVPCLRPALEVTTRKGSSLVNVGDPATGKSFQLYDFEVSLARMLDGRRSHADIVEAARQVGLPVTFDSLVRFVRELERYGFLSPAGAVAAPPPEPEGGPGQESWDEATRALYQSGLRMHRQGRYHESAAYFEAMLVQDPKNAQALEMLQQAKQRATEPPAAGLTPLPNPAGGPIEAFDELSLDDAPGAAAAPVASMPAAPAAPSPVVPTRVPAVSPMKWVAVALVGLAAAIGVGWKFLLPTTQGSVEIRPPVAQLVIADAGAVAPAPLVQQAPAVDAAVEVAIDPPAAAADAAVEVAVAPPAVDPIAPSAEPDAGAVGVEGRGRDWQTFAITRRGRVKMGSVVASGAGTVSWKVAADQRVKRGELVAVLQTAEGEKRLVSPVQGLVIQTVASGAVTTAQQEVGEILYHEAYLQTVVTGRQPDASWACEVLDKDSEQRADCTIGTVTPRGAGFFVTAILLPRWFDSAANPTLRLAPP